MMVKVTRATFITIERALIPEPPRDAEPYWCYSNTLMFKHKETRETLWEQKIPEARLSWCKKREDRADEFDSYFQCSVFFDKNFGWQLRCRISHYAANLWHKRMMEGVERYHQNHFKKSTQLGSKMVSDEEQMEAEILRLRTENQMMLDRIKNQEKEYNRVLRDLISKGKILPEKKKVIVWGEELIEGTEDYELFMNGNY